jgi:hypothetical protein
MRHGSSCTIEPFLVPPYPDEKRGAGFWDEYTAAPSAMHIIGQKQELRAETLAAHDGAGFLCRLPYVRLPRSRVRRCQRALLRWWSSRSSAS